MTKGGQCLILVILGVSLSCSEPPNDWRLVNLNESYTQKVLLINEGWARLTHCATDELYYLMRLNNIADLYMELGLVYDAIDVRREQVHQHPSVGAGYDRLTRLLLEVRRPQSSLETIHLYEKNVLGMTCDAYVARREENAIGSNKDAEVAIFLSHYINGYLQLKSDELALQYVVMGNSARKVFSIPQEHLFYLHRLEESIARYYAYVGDRKKATEAYKDYISTFDSWNSPFGRYGEYERGLYYLMLSRYDKAIEHFQEAIRMILLTVGSESSDARLPLNRRIAASVPKQKELSRTSTALAFAFYCKGDLKTGEAYYRQARLNWAESIEDADVYFGLLEPEWERFQGFVRRLSSSSEGENGTS